MRLRFRFRWVPFVAAVLVIAAGVSLGNWQTRRAVDKLAIEQAITARSAEPALVLNDLPHIGSLPEFRRVRVAGRFVADWPVYLDNRPYQGKAGFVLLMPLRLQDSERVVLVARGWLPRDPLERSRLPDIVVPDGVIQLDGTVRHSAWRVMQLGQDAPLQPGAILQNLDIAAFSSASKLPLQTFIIEQTNDAGDTLAREWPRLSAGVDKHRGYAFQWYALAATAFLFFLVTGFRRASRSSNNTR